MASRILILGAAGRLGRVAAEAFREAGWDVTSLVRPGRSARAAAGTTAVEVDALDHEAVAKAARGAAVVLHALNPVITSWAKQALPLAYSALFAAETAGATLMFPGSLYNYGSPLPLVIEEDTPMRASSHKGRLRIAIEDRLQEGAEERGVRTIIIRSGDFFGGNGRGSWLDLVIAKDIAKLRLTYPGPLDIVHAWAYLPDLAAVMVRLADLRNTLPAFASYGFPGHSVTGEEFTRALAKAVRNRLRVTQMSWWLIHALAPFMQLPKEISELHYLWKEPHRISGEKLAAAIGEIPHTPLDVAAARAIQDLAVNA
ncbi:MAG: NAD-dependent epimerase/dehydratase family protein [Xanthobacteraceae bacterium]